MLGSHPEAVPRDQLCACERGEDRLALPYGDSGSDRCLGPLGASFRSYSRLRVSTSALPTFASTRAVHRRLRVDRTRTPSGRTLLRRPVTSNPTSVYARKSEVLCIDTPQLFNSWRANGRTTVIVASRMEVSARSLFDPGVGSSRARRSSLSRLSRSDMGAFLFPGYFSAEDGGKTTGQTFESVLLRNLSNRPITRRRLFAKKGHYATPQEGLFHLGRR